MLQDAGDAEGLWDFGFRIADRVTVAAASRWGPRVARGVTLLHAIQIMSDWIRVDMPNVVVGLEDGGDFHWFWRDHQPDRRELPGYYFGEQYILDLMVQIVRMAEGPEWTPSRVQVQAPPSAWAFKRPEFALDGTIEYGARRTAIAVPTKSLSHRLRGREPMPPDSFPVDESAPKDLIGSLHHSLMGIACEQPISLNLGAELSGCSKRSLQRALANAGTSWREIIERVHLETALDLMEDPSNSLADIAAGLGYSQYPHFLRAFRRWTGEAPGKYRQRLAT
jgi:AraC-like DNA-binding protein